MKETSAIKKLGAFTVNALVVGVLFIPVYLVVDDPLQRKPWLILLFFTYTLL